MDDFTEASEPRPPGDEHPPEPDGRGLAPPSALSYAIEAERKAGMRRHRKPRGIQNYKKARENTDKLCRERDHELFHFRTRAERFETEATRLRRYAGGLEDIKAAATEALNIATGVEELNMGARAMGNCDEGAVADVNDAVIGIHNILKGVIPERPEDSH